MLSAKGDHDSASKEWSEQVPRWPMQMKNETCRKWFKDLGEQRSISSSQSQILPLEVKSSCSQVESLRGWQKTHHLQIRACRPEKESLKQWLNEASRSGFHSPGRASNREHCSLLPGLGVGLPLRQKDSPPSLENLLLTAMISSSSLVLLLLPFIHPQIPYFQWKRTPTLQEGWEDHCLPSIGLLPRFYAFACPPCGACSSPGYPHLKIGVSYLPGVTKPPRGPTNQNLKAPRRPCDTLFPKILLNY